MWRQIHQGHYDGNKSEYVQYQDDAFDHGQEPTDHGVDKDCDGENSPA